MNHRTTAIFLELMGKKCMADVLRDIVEHPEGVNMGKIVYFDNEERKDIVRARYYRAMDCVKMGFATSEIREIDEHRAQHILKPTLLGQQVLETIDELADLTESAASSILKIEHHFY